MKFSELHETIPYAKGGKEKVLRYSPYPNITLAMPGRHAQDTVPIGGDFVVMVTDPIYPVTDHQFTHTDIFKDMELKQGKNGFLMIDYLKIVKDGQDPVDFTVEDAPGFMPGLHPKTFLYAVQCLAVAEHRRYAKYESKFGGRFLPFRFAAGIAEGLWTAADAANLQRKGRPGVEMLEKQKGVPLLTKELME
jgi:hypothetical protein